MSHNIIEKISTNKWVGGYNVMLTTVTPYSLLMDLAVTGMNDVMNDDGCNAVNRRVKAQLFGIGIETIYSLISHSTIDFYVLLN